MRAIRVKGLNSRLDQVRSIGEAVTRILSQLPGFEVDWPGGIPQLMTKHDAVIERLDESPGFRTWDGIREYPQQ